MPYTQIYTHTQTHTQTRTHKHTYTHPKALNTKTARQKTRQRGDPSKQSRPSGNMSKKILVYK